MYRISCKTTYSHNSCEQNQLSGHSSITIYGIFLGYDVVSGEVS
ncbi:MULTISPECIES: hypothetical protein [Microcystis]|uniref:Uncharacterized protein n=2 Tax=Microcystis aeruginosa (strain PCC 7806) TaxID=267872 RepID=A0AB33BXE2_MICA7|nr:MULTISPECIES: hypothetical protein [Microcystis]ARI84507.1 hypothetical protein BH695_5228 [Microcystis aeruginosa PCC 7806SL]ELS45635.1 hypothetical protein C789_4627 [Microcystis aeruginosa FACHB-905 = DIANCHI905]WKX62618.1 hypothetical protein Q3H53_002643 [Microcystis aeruginosa PCC 7806]CAO86877.1 unnamed protein product [Microcystis aeruginosa PCC 7806]